ncbi:tRNA pseudouridine(55) synthase TruB [Candidatus Parcubacteria bacterium]|nr:MAG: tRNA pseudouridine(55) synthase TruB [Candidatus Parcubacteria bacterium]
MSKVYVKQSNKENYSGNQKPKVFAIYKPKGPTSNQVLNKIRKFFGTKKVGHAGTLDPLAEGILVVGVGREATKQLKDIVSENKEYLATIKFGEASSTDDAEGVKTKTVNPKKVPKDKILETLKDFSGFIEQRPPIFSAIKTGGIEAYKLARKGKEVYLKKRKVRIDFIRLVSYKWPYLKIAVGCGPGVYIRSLARDLGKKFGVGAYLFDLVRIRVGKFFIGEAIKLAEIDKLIQTKS